MNPVADLVGNDLADPKRATNRAHDLRQRRPGIHAAWLIVPCLACDLLMAPALSFALGTGRRPHDFVAAFAFGVVGCVLAQGCLLAAWLVWSDGRFLGRLRTHWKIAAGLYLVWLPGLWLVVAREDDAVRMAATVALGVPLVSLAAQVPLWLARHLFGWRLVRPAAGEAPPQESPLSIRDLMFATLVVAASLALARVAPADGKDVWPVWGVAFTVAGLISSISLLPAAAFILRSSPLSRGLKWSGLYAAAWIALEWIVVAVLRLSGVWLAPRPLFVGLSGLMLAFAATLVLTGVIARSRGYRLISRKERSRLAI